jgi:hypothetical protein
MSIMAMTSVSRRFLPATLRRGKMQTPSQQRRPHHPDPFNPKSTRGWKAALMVRVFYFSKSNSAGNSNSEEYIQAFIFIGFE